MRISSRETRRRSYTVRLVGIDTPETRKPGTPIECGGKEATSNLLRLSFSAPTDSDGDGLLDAEGGSGDRATVTTDPTQDTFDRYGRLLAYVTTDDGQNLAVEQLRAGWTETYLYERRFRQWNRFEGWRGPPAASGRARGRRAVATSTSRRSSRDDLDAPDAL